MSEVKDTLADALELRAVRLGFLASVLLAVALCFVPLFDILSFERAFATGLLASVVSAAVGVSLVRAARERGGDDLARVAAHAAGISLLMLVPSLVAGVVVELLGTPCDQEQGVLFLLLVAGGNAVVCSALGVVAGTLGARRLVPGLLVSGSLLGFLLAALYRLYSEPQIFLYSLPFGYWPGSLYDEELQVEGALWSFRGFSLLFTLALLSAARMLAPRATLRLRLSWPRPAAAISTVVLCFAALTVYRAREAAGFGLSRRTIERELSRHVETPHFSLYVSPGVGAEELAALVEDHELRYRQLTRFFGRAPAGKVKSFVYASEQEKRRWMGAAGTMIARPWERELHIHGTGTPHPVLKHELAHVFAADLAKGPFKVPSTALVSVNMALVEGLAVAADWPVNELSVHGWTRAMRALGLAPDLTQAMNPAGFWSLASTRAYTSAGSFVRWLYETRGIERLARAYAGNDFAVAYEEELPALVAQWEAFIDAIELPQDQLTMAEHRFRRPSIFQKVCAHRAANLGDEAYARMGDGDLDGAAERIEALLAYAPGSVQPLIDLGQALARAGRLDEARRLAKRAEETPGVTAKNLAEARELVAGLDWRRGQVAEARAGFEKVLTARLSAASDRVQQARLAVLARTSSPAPVLRDLLLSDLTGPRALVRLGEHATRHPSDALGLYLYGRQLEAAGAWEEGAQVVERALALGLTPAALRPEAEHTLGRLLYRAGRRREAEVRFQALAGGATSEALRLGALDWAERARPE